MGYGTQIANGPEICYYFKKSTILPEQKLVWVKIVDFLIMAFFRVSCNLGATPSITIDIEGHGSNFTEIIFNIFCSNFSSSSLFLLLSLNSVFKVLCYVYFTVQSKEDLMKCNYTHWGKWICFTFNRELGECGGGWSISSNF